VVTSKQRREQSRRQLERQLEARQQAEAARKRRTLIATIAGTVIVAVVVVIVVVLATSGNDKKKPAANSTAPSSPAASGSTSAPASKAPAATGPSVTFNGVTVKGAADLKGAPGVTSASATDPKKLEYKDLVVGKGKAATPKSNVTVQYTGVLYKTGTEFDSSWENGGQPATFTLGPGNVIDGFTQGIGGGSGTTPMKAGGRRVVIMPASLAYKDQAQGSIPANSALVFVIDLKSVN
jgi:FKBP-type peptidyl-prolyl cis-trans isomerase